MRRSITHRLVQSANEPDSTSNGRTQQWLAGAPETEAARCVPLRAPAPAQGDIEATQASWNAVDLLAARIAGIIDPAVSARIRRVRPSSEEEVDRLVATLHELYDQSIDQSLNTDLEQQRIAIAHSFLDTWVAEGSDDSVVAALQAQLADLPRDPDGSMVLVVWYVVADPAVRAPVRELFATALRDLLGDARAAGRPIAMIVGECESHLERTYNRYGLRRPYYQGRDGALNEVPYRIPSEDNRNSDVVEHLLVAPLNGRSELTPDECLSLVDGLYAEYVRPEYFTVDVLRAAAARPGSAVPRIAGMSAAAARAYHEDYKRLLASYRANIDQVIRATASPVIVLLSEREKRDRRAQGLEVYTVASGRTATRHRRPPVAP